MTAALKWQIFRISAKWIVAVILLAAFGAIVLSSREPRYGGKTLSRWIADLPDEELPSEQARAIRAIGTNALPSLIQWLQSFGPEWQRKGVEFLQQHTFFEWSLLDPWAKPNRAIVGLRILATNAAPAIPAVLRLMDNSHWEVRCLAIAALEAIGAPDVRATSALMKSLGDARPEVRMNSAAVLGEIGRGSSNAVNALVRALNDCDSSVVRAAIWGFGRLGPDAEAILPLLLSHTNIDSKARRELVHILKPIKGDAAVLELGSLMHDSDPNVRLTATSEAAAFTNNPVAVTPLLIEQLEDSEPRVQMAAVRVLTKFGTRARLAVPALVKLYKQHSDEPQGPGQRQRQQPVLIATALVEIDPVAASNAGIDAKDYEQSPFLTRSRRARQR